MTFLRGRVQNQRALQQRQTFTGQSKELELLNKQQYTQVHDNVVGFLMGSNVYLSTFIVSHTPPLEAEGQSSAHVAGSHWTGLK